MKICSFFGHHEIIKTEPLIKNLKNIIENLITNENIDEFWFGGFSEFDELCWEIVTNFKNTKYPLIKRTYCLSDPRHERPSKRPQWLKDEDYEDFIYLTFFDYWYSRIYFRNCAMIDESDYVVFYVKKKQNSGAYKTYQYALKKKKKIINLFEESK